MGKLNIRVVKFYNHGVVQPVIGICESRSPISSANEFFVLFAILVNLVY